MAYYYGYHRSRRKKAGDAVAAFLVLLVFGLWNWIKENPQKFYLYFGIATLAVIGFFVISAIIRRRKRAAMPNGGKPIDIAGKNFVDEQRLESKVRIGQTKQARLLWGALKERGIDAQTEYWDGHKHIDVAIPKARLYIELDGIQHSANPRQMLADFKRDQYSQRDGFRTLRISNRDIKYDLNGIANAIAEVVREAKS